MATLLRVLCQYASADYAAIARADSEDPSTFRLIASGVYEKITPRDLLLSAEEAHVHCPANLMIKVALTGKVSPVQISMTYPFSRLPTLDLPRPSGSTVSMGTKRQEPHYVYLSRLKDGKQVWVSQCKTSNLCLTSRLSCCLRRISITQELDQQQLGKSSHACQHSLLWSP